jgi:hypothetical protein
MTREDVSESQAVEPVRAVSAKAVDDQLIDELVSRAQTGARIRPTSAGCCNS